jgi:ATP-dependent DNA helicase RecQ
LIDQSEGSEEFKRVSASKLDALLGLCETAGCRRVRLLHYFGETYLRDGVAACGNCDTCLDPPRTWDATEAARKALSAIYRTGQRFGAVHLVDVLLGRETDRVIQWNHNALTVFGIGSDIDDTGWRNVFRQLVALGYASPDHTAYGALKLNEASRAVLKGEVTVLMRHVRERVSRARRIRTTPETADADPLLLEKLREWRADQAREQAVPAYVIFHDRTLAAIAAARPADLEELAGIPGIGTKKLERYGQRLIELVAE